MNQQGRLLLCAVLGGGLLVPAALAQSAPQSQPSQTDQSQYQGVSNPPPDDTIVASPDAPPPAPIAKPSPAVPLTATPPVSAVAPVRTAPANSLDNTDDGIVTEVPPPGSAAASDDGNVGLKTRSWNADADIVNVVPASAHELAAGTNIRVRIMDLLSTTETPSGAAFHATVATDVYKDGRVIIPAGAELRGRVVGVHEGRHLGAPATIHLRPDYVLLPDGTAYHLYAQVVGSEAPSTRTDSEGDIQPASHLKKDAAEYGLGAGSGALVGAQVGGPAGAAVGSLVGAGVITIHLLKQPNDTMQIPKGSLITFSLMEPMELTPTRN